MVNQAQLTEIKDLMQKLSLSAVLMQEILKNCIGRICKSTEMTEIEADKVIYTLEEMIEVAKIQENQEVAA